jgi:hypothetical protein
MSGMERAGRLAPENRKHLYRSRISQNTSAEMTARIVIAIA